MSSTEYKTNLKDIFFILNDVLKAEDLTRFAAFKDFNRELFDEVIRSSAEFAEKKIAPTNRAGDRQGAKIKDGKLITPEGTKELYQEFIEAGWVGAGANPDFGGMGLPTLVTIASQEPLNGANPAFFFYCLLSASSARLIDSFGSQAQKDLYLEKMYSGEWSGTMCLTESQAGSYLADVRSTTKPKGDHYLLTGSKQFITAGDHDLTENIIHLVLARTPDAPTGIKGLSLFIIPKYRLEQGKLVDNDVHLVSVEDKMGIKASSTCVLSFGDRGDCHAYLLQEPHRGMSQMFQMMNEARISVALQGVAAAGAAWENTLCYANERIQGVALDAGKNSAAKRVPIVAHPDVRDKLMYMKSLTEGMRGAVFATAKYADLAEHCSGPEQEYYKDLLEIHTPIMKAYATDEALNVVSLGIQILGGVGYTKDFPLEQNYRDLRIAPIYEGTNAIQALDLITRKLSQKSGGTLRSFLKELQSVKDWEVSSELMKGLIITWRGYSKQLVEVCQSLKENFTQKGVRATLLNAGKVLHLFGDVTIAYHLLCQGLAAEEKLKKMQIDPDQSREAAADSQEARFLHNKLMTVRYFIENVLPRQEGCVKIIKQADTAALDAFLSFE